MTSVREKSAIAAKQIALREQLWPNVDAWLWQRKANKGFTTIPKTFPLILQIMDEMTKDTPVSRTYMALWCSTWDNSFVNLSKPKELAHASGFSGQRRESTWISRMRLLAKLNFISIADGKSGPMSHAIIWNPHHVIRMHHAQKTPGLAAGSYNALVEWALEIGAGDMTTPYAAPAAASAPAEPPPAAAAEPPSAAPATSAVDVGAKAVAS
ncbi:hypothetical protein [Methylobacterium sp. Leaf106]|uniref:hypothetical protein n=1 Tax=Methylobacterium sp. Leaf106 TaxID=1736255 RepID=UPI0009E96565|nr:hypothetical protein [Methylobacterium sp. Leaf106]